MGGCASKKKAPVVHTEYSSTALAEVPSCDLPPVNKGLALQHSVLGKLLPEDVTEVYEIGQVLGAGQFGTTRLATHKASGMRYACKSINKTRLRGNGVEDVAVRQELQIMHHLAGHPHIVSLKEAYEDHIHVHLIMELCTGGDLVDRIMAQGHYTERDAAALVRTMLEVTAYCHEMGVLHRDLKPDNFLLNDPSGASSIKATDFGLSCFFKPGQRLHDVCGTAFYIAPEVLMKDYDERADVWAIGVVLYILLCGTPPFYHARDDDVFREIIENGRPDFSAHVWQHISQPAKDCVQLMMTYDFRQRPSARDMLLHEWVKVGGVAGDTVIEPEVLHRLRSFAGMNKLKKHALLQIAQRLSVDELKGLQEMFAAMDTDNSGTISLDELRQGLASRGAAVPDDLLEHIMEMADLNKNRCLDYDEFVSATMHMVKMQQEENLLAAFKHFDLDSDGFITRDELEAALADSSLDARELAADIAEVLVECDTDQDGRIDYSEFVSMMCPASLSQCSAARFANSWLKAQEAKAPAPAGHRERAETATAQDQAR